MRVEARQRAPGQLGGTRGPRLKLAAQSKDAVVNQTLTCGEVEAEIHFLVSRGYLLILLLFWLLFRLAS